MDTPTPTYLGECATHIDEKGRIVIPRRFRDLMTALGHDAWYMTRGFDNCIFLFHRDAWNEIRTQVGRFSSMNAKALTFRRLLFGSVAEARPDGQGRLMVPPHLREHAGLGEGGDNEAVLIGTDDHIELWSKSGWRVFNSNNEAEFKEIATQLFVGNEMQSVTA